MKIQLSFFLTSILCFLFIATPARAIEIEIEVKKGNPNTAVISVWDFRGFSPRVGMFDSSSLVKCVYLPTTEATETSKATVEFTLPQRTSTQTFVNFAILKTKQSLSGASKTPCSGDDALIEYLGETKMIDLPEGQTSTLAPSSSLKPSFSFSLPKDPTRFAGMKILDLFNPIGTGAGLLQIILGLALAVSFLFFALGAVRYMLSAGDAKKAEEARNHITMAVVGLVIVVVAFFLVQILGRMFGTGVTR
ncbi:MAG: hypothetical protein Q8R11_02845 [bacterium]|nr:hypothetical protein [bacterium]